MERDIVKKDIELLKSKVKYQIENLGAVAEKVEKLEKSVSTIAEFTDNEVMPFCQEQKEYISYLEEQMKNMESKVDDCCSELQKMKIQLNETSAENVRLKRKLDEALAEMEENKNKVNMSSAMSHVSYYPTEDSSSKASVKGSCYGDDSNDGRTLLAIKGKNWEEHYVHLNSWLEKKLNVKRGTRDWRIKDYGSKDKHKLVTFNKLEHRSYIWTNREMWKEEGIWLWQELGLTFTPVDVPGKLRAFAQEHRRLGHHVVEKEAYIEVDGEKWAWVGQKNQILKVNEAVLSNAGHACWFD